MIDECDRMSFADIPFPQVVAHHAAAGVHSYRADLIRRQKVCYGDAAAFYEAAIPLQDGPEIATAFRDEEVSRAVQAIQRGEIGYDTFLRQIMQAGCAGYCVFIKGRKVVYFGRDGDCHIENFPDARA